MPSLGKGTLKKMSSWWLEWALVCEGCSAEVGKMLGVVGLEVELTSG